MLLLSDYDIIIVRILDKFIRNNRKNGGKEMIGFIVFTMVQIVNSGLQTAKTMILAKSDSPHLQAFSNAVAFGFYAIVVRMIADIPLWVSVGGSMVANIVGVYIVDYTFKKIKKVKLWRIEVTLNGKAETEKMKTELLNCFVPVTYNGNSTMLLYCYTTAHSNKVIGILSKYKYEKYNIVECLK